MVNFWQALVTRGKLNKELGKFSQARQDLETVLESKKATVKQKAQQEVLIFFLCHFVLHNWFGVSWTT